MNMKLSYLVFLMPCFLIGCTSNLNQKTIKGYNGHSLNAFIKDRFTINNSLNHALGSGLDVLASLSSKNQRTLYGYYSSSEPLPDGSYVFFAPFNGPEALEKPKNELSLFCEAQEGKLQAITYYDKDILSPYETNPMQAYVASVRELNQVRITNAAGSMSVSRSLTDGEINSIAMGEAIRTANENRYADIAYAKKDYYSAMKNGSFGLFDCISHKNKRVLWSVSIIPIAYGPADKEHLISDALYIGIKGFI
jgi:hypothetical protein